MSISPLTRYLDMTTAAVYLGMSRIALFRRVQRRTIPFIRDGHRFKFDREALDSYMSQRQVAPEPRPDPR